MKKLPLLLLAALLLPFTGCDRNSSNIEHQESADALYDMEMVDIPVTEQPAPEREEMYDMPMDVHAPLAMHAPQKGGPAGATNVSQPPAAASDTIQKQIIKTASLVYEVKQLQAANGKVDSLVKRMGGYISSSNQNNNQQRHELNLTLRVPSRYFDGLLDALSTLPERVDHKSIEAQDVTEQYVDLRSRLQTKKKVEKRYQELLQKANTVKEILEVEEKLRQLQEEIEAREFSQLLLHHFTLSLRQIF